MIRVTCDICKAQGISLELSSNIIAKTNQEAMRGIGEEIAKHMTLAHAPATQQIQVNMMGWVTFQTLNMFTAVEDLNEIESLFEKEKEEMRTKLAGVLMTNAPEDDDEDDNTEDEDLFDDDEEDEEDEDLEDEDGPCDECEKDPCECEDDEEVDD